MYQFTLVIEQLPEGQYLGTSPELPGLIVQGSSSDEVIGLAPEIAHDLIAVMLETGQSLPLQLKPTTFPARVSMLVAV
jgi:predicted RNase H-like HicB family nuclease